MIRKKRKKDKNKRGGVSTTGIHTPSHSSCSCTYTGDAKVVVSPGSSLPTALLLLLLALLSSPILPLPFFPFSTPFRLPNEGSRVKSGLLGSVNSGKYKDGGGSTNGNRLKGLKEMPSFPLHHNPV
jgi:hypothetical protein